MNDSDLVQDRARILLNDLGRLRDDREAMSNLRRGLSAATEDRAWPWIAQWCDLANDRQRAIYTTVAAAFASHPEATDLGNFGIVLRRIAQDSQSGEEGLKTFEARFRRLLSCASAEEVCLRLPTVIQAAAQRGVAVNYRQLFLDLWYWGERVKIRWAAAYWGGY